MEAGGGEGAVGVCVVDVDKDDENMKIEVEAGRRRPDRMAALQEPTAQERAEHMFTHMQLRSWCQHCIRGRSKEELCRQGQGHPEHPEVYMDNLFMGKQTGQHVGGPRGEGSVVEGIDVDRRRQEKNGRVRLQACRSLHEGGGVREERGDIEDRQRTNAEGGG